MGIARTLPAELAPKALVRALIGVLAAALVAGSAAAEDAPAPAPAPEAEGYRFSSDWVSQNEEPWTAALSRFAGQPDVHALEIGSFEGRSAIWFLDHVLTGAGSSITCVDPFLAPGSQAAFDHNIAVSGHGERVEKIVGYSERVLRGLPLEHYDFVYIDGCHRAVCVITDAVLSWDLLEPGGVLIFDDYGFMPKEGPLWTPKLAIDAFLEIFRAQLRVLHRGYQVIVMKKPRPSAAPAE